jgi:putative spermidine/putrescine transport system permease protein
VLRSVSFGWKWGDLYPVNIDIRGWKVVFSDTNIWSSLWMTVKIAIVVVLLTLFISIPVGKSLAFYSFKRKGFIETVLFMPILIPALAVAMGIHMTMLKLGLANHWYGVVVVHLIPTVPYAIRIFRSGFERMGKKWEEQAFTLGGSGWATLWNVTFRFMLPSIRAAIYLTYVISISQYVLTALIGGGNVITLPLIYYPYFSSSNDMVLASFSFIFALLPLVFMVFVELFLRAIRYLNRRM